MPALPEEIIAAEQEEIIIRTNLRPVRLEPGAVVFEHASGTNGVEELCPADQVIIAIGQDPDFSLDHDDIALERDQSGCLRANPKTGATAHPRIFAGGDVSAGADRTVTWAIGSGQRAAWGIDASLRGAETANRRMPPPMPMRPQARPFEPHSGGIATSPATHSVGRVPAKRTLSFSEIHRGLSETEARAEAHRCRACGVCGNCRSCIDVLGCPAFKEEGGRIAIEPSLCIGCGVCAAICHNDAIHPRGDG
jgi:NADPH-dependent glutamate synthase beta subunit-like oxidoreductase